MNEEYYSRYFWVEIHTGKIPIVMVYPENRCACKYEEGNKIVLEI